MSYQYPINDAQKNNFHYAHNQLSASNPFNTLPSYNLRQKTEPVQKPAPQNQYSQPRQNNQLTTYSQQTNYVNNFQNNPLYNQSSSPFLSNKNSSPGANYQDKQNYYGQNKDDMTFKRTLRRTPVSNQIQANSYNILNNLPNNRPGTYGGTGTYRYYNYSQNKDHVGALLGGGGRGYGYEYNNSYQSSRAPGYQDNMSNINNMGLNNINENIKNYDMPPHTSSVNNTNISNSNSNLPNKTGKEIESADIPEYTQTNCSIIKEYSYKEDPNSRFRGYMEDKGKSVDNLNDNPSNALFCLFDGHGGLDVSKYLQNNFVTAFKKIIPNQNLENAFITLFRDVDEDIKSSNFFNVGSTACVVYITIENNKRVLYSANIGDTRCTLVSTSKATRLSYDDKATDINEYNRIVSSGGIIFAGRVYGQLMLSRSFGDWELKPYGVINVPHVKRVEIGDNDKYCVIGTDGVWDVLEDDDVYKLCMEGGNASAEEVCKNVVKNALLRGTMDNLSCFVIKL